MYRGDETSLVGYLKNKGYYFAVNVNWAALLRICTGYLNPITMKRYVYDAAVGLINSSATQNEERRK